MNPTPRTAQVPDEYLTIDEVMDLLRVPRSTLSNWRYRHVGPQYIRLGRQIRYPATEVRAFLDEHTVPTDNS